MNNPDGKNPPKLTSFFDKEQFISLHRAEKSSKEVSDMTAIGVRTVQRTIAGQRKKDWKVQSIYFWNLYISALYISGTYI